MGELLTFTPVDRTPARAIERSEPSERSEPEPLWRELVGAQLRAARLAAGRTLADVAAAAGISLPYLSEIERGLKEPSSEVLAAVSGALGLGLLDLTTAVSRTLGGEPHGIAPTGPLCLAV
ncbi:hypothetical protein GCM10022215_39320 [Nocardioides fonticola]|uniref:HTH cro/C1-type domain-containing protein n=1 Tax=Nocardioides fonticola TaxID=450363 RepID=A0ABP7Y177_9ACTN